MSSNLKLVNISGTVGAFIGSHAVSVCLLVGVSGAAFIPIRVDNTGVLLTSGLN